jgi:DNA-binding XRE family transcriptional regulator
MTSRIVGGSGDPSFGGQIKAQRIKRGMTQRQLADLSTVAIRTIRDLESGLTDRPHPVTVRLLASALGLTGRAQAATEHASHPNRVAADGAAAWYPPPQTAGETVGQSGTVNALCEMVIEGHRMIILTGFAGVGKTRLAAEVANHVLTGEAMGVSWVAADAGRRPSRRSRLAAEAPHSVMRLDLSVLTAERPSLLVVDDAPPGLHVEQLAARLSPYPDLRILLTSRHHLGVHGAQVIPLPPLSLPERDSDMAAVGAAAATRMLLQFVQRVQPSFHLTAENFAAVAEICRLLDGIPALLRAIAPTFLIFEADSLLECLREDLAGMVADIDPEFASAARGLVSGLDQPAATLLRGLAGLAGDWSVSEAAALLGASRLELAQGIRGLLQLGLVRVSAPDARMRFQVLEVIRAARAD